MTKHPPNRRGISFEVGAQLEARDRLKNWYPAHIQEIDYEEGQVLIHFKRWNHRYDEWFCWDSPYLRPLEKIQLRKEGLHDEEGSFEFHINEQVLACWSDCRFYPAKVTAVNKDGTYTVKFYDGVIQTVKHIHVKAFSKDQSIVGNARPKEKDNENFSSPENQEKFKEQRKVPAHAKKDKDDKTLKAEKRARQPDKEGKLVSPDKGKGSEKGLLKNEKEDKENISENDREYSGETQADKKPENDIVKNTQENLREPKRKRGRPPSIPQSEPNSQTLQPITLELRRRKISKGAEIRLKRPKLEKNSSQEKSKAYPENNDKDLTRRRSSRLSNSGSHEILDADLVISNVIDTAPSEDTLPLAKELEEGQLESSVRSDKSSSELRNRSFVDELKTAVFDLNCDSMEDKAVDSELASPLAELKEISAVTATNAIKRDEFVTSKFPTIDLDHKFRCTFVDCLKFFRKAKLLHYHMKYFHGIEKTPEPEENSVKRHVQTRGSLASEKASQDGLTRKRITSSSLSVKDKEKNKEKKFREFVRLKSKKKKKKKKKSKPEYSCSEDASDASQECSPPKPFAVTRCSSSNKSGTPLSTSVHISDSGNHQERGKIPVTTEDDNVSDSSSESFLWSDEDCSHDIDVTTNPDDDPDGEDNFDFEIVRCICEVQEENDFMIQCEECQCWQHGVCMGLLEDNVPEKYICYICQDPPGQRPGVKYWYEKEWLSHGHMHGLAFLEDNYSHQNAKKIVATHQLLGDVQKVIEVLHGLQLKMRILQSKEHPDLQLWCQPWKQHSGDEKSHPKHALHIEDKRKEDMPSYRTFSGTVEKTLPFRSMEESYITSEHCYQKPRAYYPAVEQKLVVETRGSAMDDSVNPIRENGDDVLSERFGWELEQEKIKIQNELRNTYSKVRECASKKALSEEAPTLKLLEKDREGVVNAQLQWQFNLLTHVESLQDEVTHRMDSIEKELDVLESWLDYTGELEPPEPLARLPQLKHCIKQLLTDLGKVQQIALCCST
ncbi:PHD finger protein 20 isoform X2 [Monodelphis domestica]|uniref:PHD finger protein 20 isoform X2 n=1 Tax=Monodelphis domestica TaxID=13616 RepID=UPI0024E1AD5E|nr:PHD finger protein 20 isoform X2 [Monodelphis domestica]XP_056667774.1 PHD finger protein 20 isoform X2 [Monodelphis domestica]